MQRSHPSRSLRLSISIPHPEPLPQAPKYGFKDEAVVINTTFTSATTLHKNQLIILKSRPCRILTIATSLEPVTQTATPVTPTITIDGDIPSKPAKKQPRPVTLLEITAKDIFTEQEVHDRLKDTDQVQVPINVREEEYLIVDIEGGHLVLWADDGAERRDVKVPTEGEVGDRIRKLVGEGREGFVKVRGWNGEVAIVGLTETEDEMVGGSPGRR